MDPSYYGNAYQAAVYAAAASAQQQPQHEEESAENEDWDESEGGGYSKKGNVLPFWGNQQTMNLNPLILTNIQNSPYFKVNLFELKTYHEVIDEIYYKVAHLEPWEKGSRKTSGQTGMCGGVRGVGAGGIVSSAFCLLYKLSTLKLTRKQINGLLNHADSPYIRGLGFMYLRFTQPPADLWDWFEDYLDDEEVIDVKAGGGKEITIGEMLKQFLTKLEWFDTRFPRIPINVQKEIADNFEQLKKYAVGYEDTNEETEKKEDRRSTSDYRHDRRTHDSSRRDKERHHRDRDRSRKHDYERSRDRDRDRNRDSKHKRRSRSRDRDHGRHRHDDYQNELKKYSEHRKKEKKHKRSRSRSRSRDRRR